VKVLFVIRTSGFLRNFEGVIREMRRGGHEVVVAVEAPNKRDSRYAGLVADLGAEGVSFAKRPRLNDAARDAAIAVRLGLDYLRYFDARYSEDSKLRARAAQAAPAAIRRLADAPVIGSDPGRRALRRALLAFDAAAPVAPAIGKFLDRQAPDLLLVTPLVELGAAQNDWIRAARARGIPTVLPVASWDNLTVKGGLREWPDRILVWNDAQVREASEIHSVPAERLVATGAHTYDHWFDWQPSRTREAFCAEVGLPADRPFLLYLCSSPFIAPGESEFVRDWIGALRSSDRPELREVGVLVRPHPQHAAQWDGVDVADLGAAALWPRGGADPVDGSSRSDFFDSMVHCAGVVGINTSAQIESAIVGRDVFTLLDPRFASTQEGTLHFAHIAREDGGLLQVARSAEEHHAQLSALLRGELDSRTRRERFLREFVRPNGLDVRSAPSFVAAIEDVRATAGPPSPAPPQVLAVLGTVWRVTPWRMLRALLSPSYRARLVRQAAKYVRLIRQISLRGPEPPRTVADLLPPEQNGVPRSAHNGSKAPEPTAKSHA
jgi:hypothetical protein